MVDVIHKTLPDSELHEPKGVVSAGSGMVYAANGAGTGTWKRVTSDMLTGVSGTGQAGQAIVLDGSGGFVAQSASAYYYGAAVLTAAGAGQPDTVIKFAPTNNWTQTTSNNVTLSNNQFIFGQAGLYHMTFTISRYEVAESTSAIRTLLFVDQSSNVIVAVANDSVSSTTVSAIFRVPVNGTLTLTKVQTSQGLPGVLGQYAFHRIGG